MTQSLHIESLRVERLPGIDQPFTVDAFSPGLNLVHGPNGSGKSSLVRALNALLWPAGGRTDALTLTATVRSGGDRWRLQLDGGRLTATRNDAAAPPPVLPSPELRARYHLALHELLSSTDDGGDFAQAIARASAGGLDVGAAAGSLRFVDTRPRRGSVRSDFDAARTALGDARTQSTALHAEAATLGTLDQAIARALDAQRTVVSWRSAMQWLEARRAHADAVAARAAIPPEVAALDGSEADQLGALHERWQQVARDLHDARQRAALAEAEAAGAFHGAMPGASDRDAWRAHAAAVREAERGSRARRGCTRRGHRAPSGDPSTAGCQGARGRAAPCGRRGARAHRAPGARAARTARRAAAGGCGAPAPVRRGGCAGECEGEC